MEETRKLLFVINPVSGIGRQKTVENLIGATFPAAGITAEIAYTSYAGHAKEIAAISAADYFAVIAVGGDGTVNEVAAGLAGTDCCLGVVPAGSGNGFARHIGMSMYPAKAVASLAAPIIQRADAAEFCGKLFVNVCGIGFDAEVAHLFSKLGHRGLISYAYSALSAITKYRPKTYSIVADGKELERKAFCISFANSPQFGNNAYISPSASLTDGLIDVCIIKPFPAWAAAPLAARLFAGSIDKSAYCEIIRCKKVSVQCSGSTAAHLDGEAVFAKAPITARALPGAMKILVPERKNNKRKL
jgi:diacylglycerol kinase (ATP)